MIRTIGDLLEELREREVAVLNEHRDLGHPTIIGDMFEGLTREILAQALFEGLDLRVVTGLIRGPTGEMSRQIDAMIVVGDGESIPHTEHVVYESDAVVAVVEVKTRMHRDQLADAYANLLSVIQIRGGEASWHRAIDRNYRSIVREEVPENPSELPHWKEMLFHSLVVEANQPARIALGYFGYKDEFALRRGFIDFLESNVTTDPTDRQPGFGPTSFPDLIICRKSGLVKLNGLPYCSPVDPNGWWPILGSFNDRPLVFLLEVLWTRLNLRFALPPEVFGEDLDLETTSPFLAAKAKRDEKFNGWMYDRAELTRDELLAKPVSQPWMPVEITRSQSIMLPVLGVQGSIRRDEPEFLEFCQRQQEDPEALFNSLVATGLVYDDGTGTLRYLTEQCATVMTPDGRIFAGDAAGGRLMRWVARKIHDECKIEEAAQGGERTSHN